MKLSSSHLTVAGIRIPLLAIAGVGVLLVLAGRQGGSTLMAGPLPASGTPAGAFVPIYDGRTRFPMPDPRTGFLLGPSP